MNRTPPAAPSSAVSFDVAAGRFRDFFAELSRSFVERDDVLTQIELALLAREHVLMTGPPGTAKSGIATAVLGRILDEETGSPSLFARQFTESTVQTDLVGPIDFKTLMATGRTEHFTDQGMLGAVHAFLDEVLDGRDMLLRTTLNVLNERELKQGTRVTRGLIECALMTTNRYLAEVLESSRETLLAFVDRVAFVAFVPKGFGAPDSMGKVLRSQLGGARGAGWKSVLTIQDLDVLQSAADRVAMDDSLCESLEALMSAVEADTAAATRADPSFVPTRYLSTRTAVRLGKLLRAACVLDKIKNPSRPLEVCFEDLQMLRLSLLLSGPTPEHVAALLARETDPRERRQLSIMRTEREIFDRALARVARPVALPRPPVEALDLKPLVDAVEKARPGGDTQALIEATRQMVVAAESGAPGSQKARELLEETVTSLVERALRKGLLAGVGVGGGTASGHPVEIAAALEELSLGLEKSAGTARPIGRWLRGRAIALLDDAASLAATRVGASLTAEMPASANLDEHARRARDVLRELDVIVDAQERLERLGADPPASDRREAAREKALSRAEDEVAEIMDGAFRAAIRDALARVGASDLGPVLTALGPAIAHLDALGGELRDMGGRAERLKARVVGPRVAPLLRAAFERLEAEDRMELVTQIGGLVGELTRTGLGDVLSPEALLEMAARALVKRESARRKETAPPSPDASGYKALRASEQRVSLAFTVVEAASRIKEPRINPESAPDVALASLTRAVGALPSELRVAMGELDVERIGRSIDQLEGFFEPLAAHAREALGRASREALQGGLDRLAASGFYRVTRDESALLRFSLEARVVGEVFPEVAPLTDELRARIERLEADSSEALKRLRSARSDLQWKDVLSS